MCENYVKAWQTLKFTAN